MSGNGWKFSPCWCCFHNLRWFTTSTLTAGKARTAMQSNFHHVPSHSLASLFSYRPSNFKLAYYCCLTNFVGWQRLSSTTFTLSPTHNAKSAKSMRKEMCLTTHEKMKSERNSLVSLKNDIRINNFICLAYKSAWIKRWQILKKNLIIIFLT